MEPTVPFSPPQAPSGRTGARIMWAEVAAVAIVAATGIALLVYFLAR